MYKVFGSSVSDLAFSVLKNMATLVQERGTRTTFASRSSLVPFKEESGGKKRKTEWKGHNKTILPPSKVPKTLLKLLAQLELRPLIVARPLGRRQPGGHAGGDAALCFFEDRRTSVTLHPPQVFTVEKSTPRLSKSPTTQVWTT